MRRDETRCPAPAAPGVAEGMVGPMVRDDGGPGLRGWGALVPTHLFLSLCHVLGGWVLGDLVCSRSCLLASQHPSPHWCMSPLCCWAWEVSAHPGLPVLLGESGPGSRLRH